MTQRKQSPGIMIYFDFWHGLRRLTLEEKGSLVDAMITYAESGNEPELEGAPGVLWDLARQRVDVDRERYAAKCEQQRQNISKRWQRDTTEYHGTNGIPTVATTTSTPTATPTTKTKSERIYTVADTAAEPPRARSDSFSSGFIPPSVEDVAAYCKGESIDIDPQHFVDHYTANGWMTGRNHMQSWRAAVRSWARREAQFGRNSQVSSRGNSAGRGATEFPEIVYDVTG